LDLSIDSESVSDKERVSERASTTTLVLHCGQVSENICPLGTFSSGILNLFRQFSHEMFIFLPVSGYYG